MLIAIHLNYENPQPGNLTFAQLLSASLARTITHKAHCNTCKHYATFSSSRSITPDDLPPILALNANAHDEEVVEVWMDKKGGERFLSPQVAVSVENDGEAVQYELRVCSPCRDFIEKMLMTNSSEYGVPNCREGHALAPRSHCQRFAPQWSSCLTL